MAGFAVIGFIRINTSQLAPQRVGQDGQYLGIMDIFQRDFRLHDIVGHWVGYRQMQLVPDLSLFGAVLSDFSLALINTFRPVEWMTWSVIRPMAGCR